MNRVFAAMFQLPLDMFTGGMDAVLTSIKGFQDVFNQQTEEMVSTSAKESIESSSNGFGKRNYPGEGCQESISAHSNNPTLYSNQVKETKVKYRDEKECQGVKLITYKISFVKKDLEAVLLKDGEEIVDDASDCGTSLEVWKTAEFVQTLHENPGKRPKKWLAKDYPDKKYRTDQNGDQRDNGEYYTGIPEEDKKFLRFYQDVLATYERESTNYQEKQANALDGISSSLAGLPQTIADAVNRGTGGQGIGQ